MSQFDLYQRLEALSGGSIQALPHEHRLLILADLMQENLIEIQRLAIVIAKDIQKKDLEIAMLKKIIEERGL